MATAKSKTTPKPPAAKKPAAQKTPLKKAATAVKKKTTIPKSASARAKATQDIPAAREQKLAEQALSLVDQAAAVLRDRIRDGATQTAKSRLAAKRKASTLLDRANRDLNKALETGTDGLKNLLRRL